MRFFHLADLHLGKMLNGYSLLEDQRHILRQIYRHASQQRPDAVVIAGDVYDRQTPSAEAVQLLDDLLTALAGLPTQVLITSGNHDSAERLGFAGRLLASRGVHIAGPYDGTVHAVSLADGYGSVRFFLLPFLKPAHVRPFFPDATINTYGDAIAAALAASPPEPGARSVLIAHQLVCAPGVPLERSDSEVEPVGGIDAVDVRLFAAYDYVALGHLHGPQRVGRDTARYAGSPLKYSFSEALQKKSLTCVTLSEKGQVSTEALPLAPLRDMRRLRGPIDALTVPDAAGMGNAEDYVEVTLTDRGEILDAIGRVRAAYPNLMELRFEPAARQAQDVAPGPRVASRRTPLSLFEDFYAAQHGEPMAESERAIVRAMLAGLEDAP